MGGTFNPVHNGHLILAENAREVFSLDEILFIPSGNSYMKDTASILAGCIRARMIELALEGNPYFSLSWIDLKREGPTYTCDTLAQLKEMNPEDQYYFIMGATICSPWRAGKSRVYSGKLHCHSGCKGKRHRKQDRACCRISAGQIQFPYQHPACQIY